MKHSNFVSVVVVAAALAAALLLAWGPAAQAEPTNYGKLWQKLSPAEKELLIIGYAKGLRKAEAALRTAIVSEEACRPEVGRRLLDQAAALAAGLETSDDVKEVIGWLDRWYDNLENHYIDWTDLVGLARARLEGESEEKIEAELVRLRRSADHLEEIRKLQENH